LDISKDDTTENNSSKPKPAPIVKPAYDKSTSFFDNISRDGEDKQSRRTHHEREEQAKLDLETFGEAGTEGRGRARGRGHRSRGRGRGGGRGSGGKSFHNRNAQSSERSDKV
jgi:protein LSM14